MHGHVNKKQYAYVKCPHLSTRGWSQVGKIWSTQLQNDPLRRHNLSSSIAHPGVKEAGLNLLAPYMGCRQTNPSLLALLLLYVCCPKMAGFKEYGFKKTLRSSAQARQLLDSESSRIVHKSILIRTHCLNRINALRNHNLKSSQLRNHYH